MAKKDVRQTENPVEQIVTYFVEDDDFQNTALLSIAGRESTDTPDLDKLDPNPVDSGLPFPALQKRIDNPAIPLSQDWLVHAFPYNGRVRVLMGNTKTYFDAPDLDETRYGLAEVPRNPYSFFSALARKILLTVDGQDADGLATNPHGILLIKGVISIANFKDDVIYFLKPNELNGLPEGTDYIIGDGAFFDVALAIEEADPDHMLEEGAHGQAMYTATDSNGVTYVYMAYLVYDTDSEGNLPKYKQSVIVKLRVEDELDDNGYPVLTYVEQALTGLNIVSMMLSTDENGNPILVMVCLGGPQRDGETNGELSGVHSLLAFGTWAEPGEVGEAEVLLTTDPQPEPGQPILSHDFHAGTTAYRGATTDKLHFLAMIHRNNYTKVDYEIYEIEASELAAMGPAGSMTISQAVAAGKLQLIDSGTDDERGPLWDMATEMGTSPAGDRRLTLKGGALEIAAVQGYNRNVPSSFVIYERGYGPWKIGGMNVNCFTMTYQAIKDAMRGIQFKHVLQGILPEALRAKAAAAKAAKIAAAAAKPGLRAVSRAAKPEEPEEEEVKE
jgi:hypothetical protein